MIYRPNNNSSFIAFHWWLLIAALVFAAGIMIGIFPPFGLRSIIEEQVSELSEIAGSYTPSTLSTFVFILFKNGLSLTASFLLSPLLVILPLASLFMNGWIIGFVGALAAEKYSLLLIILSILPHGLFEIPAFIIGEAAALSFGTAALSALFKREKRAELIRHLKLNTLRLLIALALLLPAALIETYVTPLFIR